MPIEGLEFLFGGAIETIAAFAKGKDEMETRAFRRGQPRPLFVTPAAIILASGASTRVEQPKQLLPFDGRPMLAAVIQRYLGAKLSRILVVVDSRATPVANLARNFPVHTVLNDYADDGMFSSVQAGLRAMKDGTDVFIGLCDQPLLASETINRLSAARRTGKGIIIPTHGGRGGHPILICKRFIPEILSMPVSRMLKDFVRAHPREVFRLEVADRGVVQDIDDWATYQREIKRTL